MATCSPQTLISEGECLLCLTKHELLVVIAQLLCQINESGGLSLVQVSRGSGPPAASPADPTRGAIYYDDDSGSPSYDTQWHWSVPGQLWIGA